MGTAVPTWVRLAIGLAILGVGVSLAFAFMPDSTANMRVGAGIVCVACLAFVALMWRQIGRNQKYDKILREKTPFWSDDQLTEEQLTRFQLTEQLTRLTDEYKALTKEFDPRKGIRKLGTKTREALAAVARERKEREATREMGGVMNKMGESGFYER